MLKRSQGWWILCGIALSLLLPICGSLISMVWLRDLVFRHIAVHSLIETAGGLMAVAIAGILIAERTSQSDSDHFTWMASALIGMGSLDLFHAAVHPGNNFVWLHSTATLVGGLLFAGVWLPPRFSRGRFGDWLPAGVLAGMVLFGAGSCLATALPRMTTDAGEFTLLARSLNIGGGAGFLLAGVFFVRRFHREGQNADWLFAAHTVLFGAAGILFELSVLWDAAWWWWHILRLIAYLAALLFAARVYADAERSLFKMNRQLTKLNESLDRTVEERTVELRLSEERYALAVRGSTDGLWDWNTRTSEVYYSARFKELLGFSDHEFPNQFKSFEERLHPDDHQRTLIAVSEHLEQRLPYDVEYRLKVKSGCYRWFRARGQAVWDESGEAVRMAGSITDITARKQAEDALQHERFLFESLFEHLPDAIYFKDRSGRFLRVTSALARQLGAASAGDVVGKTDADFFSLDYAEQAREDEERLMQTGEPLIGKEEHPHWADQEERWVSTTKVPLRSEDGEIVGTFGISHDITAQKMAEERFRRVLEAAPNALVVVNSTGRIQFANATIEKMFGYSRGELLGESIEVLVPDAQRGGHVAMRDAFLAQPAARAMGLGRELKGRRKDGSTLAVEIGLSPVDFDGKTVVLASIHDLTNRKSAEAALVAAKEAAESANRAKSDFLANMSHEIRTPMNAIIGMTDLVLETETNPTNSGYLNIVLESADALLSIINQILDFSRIEAGRLELELLNFDLYEELGDTLKSLGHRAHAKKLELAWHIHREVPRYLLGDAGRLRQVLINLVGNAIKFTPAGEVVVDIACDSRDASGVTLHFSVRDTGIGIPQDKQNHVFAAFEQADSSTTREFGGTGLGLAITSRIVHVMNGRIWVESAPGEGSTFHFLAKFGLGEVPADVTLPPTDLAGLSIVVVDDNETNRLILKEMVQSWGMQVTTASSGTEAIQQLQNWFSQGRSHLLLLSDVHMPEMDGFMLAEQLRSHPDLQNTAIVLLTSGGRPGDVMRSKELDIVSYLMKPVKQSELLESIILASGRSPQNRRVEHEPDHLPPMPPLNILLVEDGRANQVLARALLEKWGHRVTVAENGQDAIDCWQNGEIQLILMDVQMPVMDGLAATRRIRELEERSGRHIPIVAMTARAMKGDRERCLSAGMDDYITKPVRRQELYTAIGGFLESVPVVASDPEELASSESVPAISSPLINWTKALANVAGDGEILRDVVRAAHGELPELLRSLDESLAQSDLPTARRAVHTIKSSASILGATMVAETAQAAEQAAHDRDLQTVTSASDSLRSTVPMMVREIAAFLDDNDASQSAPESL